MKQFKIGSVVKVTDTGNLFSTHSEFKPKQGENYNPVKLRLQPDKPYTVDRYITFSNCDNVMILKDINGDVFPIGQDKPYKINRVIEVNKLKIKPMEISKTKVIEVNNNPELKREVTITVLIQNGQIRAGYSVRILSDKEEKGLSVKIARGRALKDKTNLVDMTVGQGMDRKFILYAIAENILGSIERGSIKIKGVK